MNIAKDQTSTPAFHPGRTAPHLHEVRPDGSPPRVATLRLPTAPDDALWHVNRHKAILHAHPDVRALFGIDRSSAGWAVVLGVVQAGLAVWAGHRSWWVLVAVAMTAGAVIAHALGVLIHEASHNLVFRGAWKNKLVAIVANVPLGAPAAIEFRHQHLLHHKYLGETAEPAGRDTQAPTRKEVEVVGYSSLWKLASFTFGRFFYKARTANAAPRDAWIVANAVACIGFDVALVALAGAKPLVFVVLASLAAFGPHVVGARRVAEHLTIRRGQPTNSYYGPLNRVSFDVGYHVEHHDFPAVPWRRMRALRALAAEHYDDLAHVRSWSELMARYFFDSRLSVSQYTGVSSEFLEEVFRRPRREALAARGAKMR
jgi:sphingolipid delta-4 desaturase